MKKRYLCPVCEHELSGKHYCPECHRFRKEPVIYGGGYLPNETDPDTAVFERTGGTQTADTCGSSHSHVYGVPNKDPHKAPRNTSRGSSSGASYEPSERKKKTSAVPARRAGAGILIYIVVFVIVISAVVGIWDAIWKFFRSSYEAREETVAALETELQENEVQELTEEEVLALGEPCNGYCHYEMDGVEYVYRLAGYAGDLWSQAECEVIWEESRNQIYTYGNTIWSYYEKTAEVTCDNGVYYDILCDTVTGEVMEIRIGADEQESFSQALLLAACALEPDRDRNEVWTETEAWMEEASGESYFFGEWGKSELYLSVDDYCYGTMTCLAEYDKYQ